MEADVVIVVAARRRASLLGVVRGAVRQLIVLGAWLVAFLVAPYLRPLVGDWIMSNAPDYSREYVDMLAFLASFLVLFLLALVVIEIGGRTVQLSAAPGRRRDPGWLPDARGNAAFDCRGRDRARLVLLEPRDRRGGAAARHDIYAALERSAIVDAMHNALIPG